MMGVVGAILLVLGGGILGWAVTARMGLRIRTLASLEVMLYMMEREIALHLTPLPALLQQDNLPFFAQLRHCGQQMEEGTSVRRSWNDLLKKLPIGDEERDLLRPLGDILGQYEGESQCEALLRTAKELARLQDRLQQERHRMGCVYPAVGVTVGAFFGIALL